MKSAVMGVLLVCATGTALADWVRIRSDGTVTVLADSGSVSRSGDMATMWSMINYTTPRKTDDGEDYLSSRQRLEYDCIDKLSRRLEFDRYSDLSGLGRAVYSNKNVSAWSPVAPGSVAGELFKFACGAK
jgi:hypothetical protein